MAGAEDPRVARSRAAIMAATLALLVERGLAGTTVEAVAERSGAAKTTIYRHWASKEELVFDAVSAALPRPVDPDTGDLRRDLYALVEGLVRVLGRTRWSVLLPGLIDAAQRDPALRRLHRRFADSRRRVVVGVLRRGVERGQLRADVDLDEVMEFLAGPLFYRRFVAGRRLTAADAHRAVDRVLDLYDPRERP